MMEKDSVMRIGRRVQVATVGAPRNMNIAAYPMTPPSKMAKQNCLLEAMITGLFRWMWTKMAMAMVSRVSRPANTVNTIPAVSSYGR